MSFLDLDAFGKAMKDAYSEASIGKALGNHVKYRSLTRAERLLEWAGWSRLIWRWYRIRLWIAEKVLRIPT